MQLPDYLSEDQSAALATVLEAIQSGAKEAALVGPAGSGKTTLTKEIINLCGMQCVLGTPTGKAALVLREKSGREVSTIHRLLYGGAVLDRQTKQLSFRKPGPPCPPHSLLLIDESSMVGKRLYSDLMPHIPKSAQVLWVGDREQLEPVKDTWGPDLKNPTAALTKVHRQAELSPIIRYATAIREGSGSAWESAYDNSEENLQVYNGIEDSIAWLVDARRHNEDATLLAYTHRTRRRINQVVREELGLLREDLPISEGEKLVVRSNNQALGLMNGEVVTVHSVKMSDNDTLAVELEELPEVEVLIQISLIESDPADFRIWKTDSPLPKSKKDRHLHVHYGQCLTVHSSQGSQWKKVGYVYDGAYRRMRNEDPEGARRFLYTAVTRASEQLALFLE